MTSSRRMESKSLYFSTAASHLKTKTRNDCVNVNINFNVVFMMMETQMQGMGLMAILRVYRPQKVMFSQACVKNSWLVYIPPGRHPQRQRHPYPPGRHPLDNPPPPPPGWPLHWTVRILLECILVTFASILAQYKTQSKR